MTVHVAEGNNFLHYFHFLLNLILHNLSMLLTILSLLEIFDYVCSCYTMMSNSPSSSSVGRLMFSGGTRLGSIKGRPRASRRASSIYASLWNQCFLCIKKDI